MELDDLVKEQSEWLKASGPKSDIVMSTRVRIARNIDGYPFFNWAKAKERQEALEKMVSALKKCDFLRGALIVRMKKTTDIDRQFLVERHLMSKEHAQDVEHKGLLISDREIVSIMLNEEDHMRLQVLQSGFNIMEAWRITEEVENELGEHLEFAYSNRFGYLTSCPTNTGTGLRASVMLHLPALEMSDQIHNVYEGISKLGMTIRGFYGEGSEAVGDFFQISNQVALGHSEMDLLDNLERVMNKIIAREEDTRSLLLAKRKQEISDNVARSYETLKVSKIITSREAIRLLSIVRLGVNLGLLKGVSLAELNEILIEIQPAHLQKMNRKELNPYERDMKRGDLIREKLNA